MPSNSIVFIDSRVANYQSLIDSLNEPYEVFILDGDKDGLDQMAAYLKGRNGLDAIHVVSHGSVGALYLGRTVLDSSNLASYGEQLNSLGGSLTQTGDILLYGCNVAQGPVGVQFIEAFTQATRADVAASSNVTGAAAWGGDWLLEQRTGTVDAQVLASSSFAGVLAGNTAPTFTVSDGKLTTDFGSWADSGQSVTLQADGKILVAGYALNVSGYSDFALARYNTNGSLDTSLDADGKLTTDLGGNDSVYSVTLQADDKILVAGSSGSNFALARYNTNGSLDTSFDTDGKMTTDFGPSPYGHRVALQADGKILVAGSGYDINGGYDFALARYNANGSPDTSFDADGKLTTDFGSIDISQSVTIQGDGKILVAGHTYNANSSHDFALARFNANGSLDTSFDTDGKLTTDFGSSDRGQSVTLQADGKILVAGYTYNSTGYGTDFALVRYNTNGSLDTSFDTDGKLITDFGTSSFGQSVTLQTDGKILVAGSGYDRNGGSNFALARYNTNGSLDTSFDTYGVLTTNFYYNSPAAGYSVKLQGDGKILLGGGSSGDFALARYNSDGSLDASFGSVVSVLDGNPTYTGSTPVVLDADVQIFDAELRSTSSYSGATLTLVRHAGADNSDVFSAKDYGTLSALASGGFFSVGTVTIGRVVSNSSGKLELGFNSNATEALVSSAMQQIAYANTASIPSAQVQIDWTFNDGNTGVQGSGGAMTATGSTMLKVTARNVPPVVSNALKDYSILPNAPINVELSKDVFFDANKDDPLIFSISMGDGTALPTWLTFNATSRTLGGNPGTLGIFDLNAFDIKVTATDIAGATASDIFRLTVTNGTLTGNSSNEVFTAGTGNDAIDGGSGKDTVIFAGERLAHTITKTSAGWTINSPTGGTDTIQNVERLKFNDATVALDIDGNGGQAYRVYQAAFNRTPDSGGLGFWINTMDSGASLRNVAEGFVGSAEFKALYGTNATNAQIVTKLYDNVLHRAGECGGFNFWLGVLDSKAETLAGVLAAFSESAENQAGLVGVIGNGFVFTPYI